jgi:hypothetical protein
MDSIITTMAVLRANRISTVTSAARKKSGRNKQVIYVNHNLVMRLGTMSAVTKEVLITVSARNLFLPNAADVDCQNQSHKGIQRWERVPACQKA